MLWLAISDLAALAAPGSAGLVFGLARFVALASAAKQKDAPAAAALPWIISEAAGDLALPEPNAVDADGDATAAFHANHLVFEVHGF
jgi:hypothetical protein